MTPLRSVRPRSLLRYSPALLAFIFVVADAGRWADPDLWGHLVFGRLILTHGHLPPRDIYSYSATGLPWHDHEWLSEVVLALCWSGLGVVRPQADEARRHGGDDYLARDGRG